MKKAVLSSVMMVLCILALAQAPESFNYQVVVRDGSTNSPLTDQNVSFRMSILKGSSPGESQYSELHSANTGALGIVNLVIGNGTGKTGNITTIDWGADTYYLKVEIDKTGGSTYVEMGTTQLLSVPYALYAKTVANYSETDPVFIAQIANGITSTLIGNWNAAYDWGNHALIGYVPGTRTLTINGTALNLSDNRSWSVGTVTSVGLTLPSIFSVSGSPITTSGTLDASLASQTANLVFASPDGGAGNPSFRALVASDVPSLDWNKITSGKPTTLSGYGITDAVTTIGDQTIGGTKTFSNTITGNINGNSGTVTNGVYNIGSYADPAWITSLDGSKITGNISGNAGSVTNGVYTTGDQTIAGNKTFTGTTSVPAPTNATDAATKAYVDAIKLELYDVIGANDIDNNHYNVVKIGTQIWTKENLKTTRYSNGDLIGTTTPATKDISGETTPKYQWAAAGNESNVATYGRFYTWYAVTDSRNICPTGWHIPTDAEWTTLTDYLTNNGYGYQGSGNDIGKSMAATSGWLTDPTEGNVGNDQASNNSSGFTALPSGYRDQTGIFTPLSYGVNWWSSTENTTTVAYYQIVYYAFNYVIRSNNYKQQGFSVRCLKN